jgi:phenylpropionate dioxygenase-like ring-hydroxylating dioxygenase large terminal subunit
MAHVALVRKLLAEASMVPRTGAGVGEVTAAVYTSAERFERERASIMRRFPVIVAHEDELRGAGACLATEVGGVPILVVRAPDGQVRAFKNSCRHRGTQLVAPDAPCRKKAIVCPYHGWTYDLDGERVHVPHESSFGGRAADRARLASAHAAVRHGFVWVSLEPTDIAPFLGPIDADLAEFGFDGLALYRQSSRDVNGNWKLVIDAFLDGYHIRTLHRDSVYRFFLDGRSAFQEVGRHIRAVTGRRTLLQATEPIEHQNLRELATPSYLLFPNTIVILHPDYVSVVTATPLAADRTRFKHWMLIPRLPDQAAPGAQDEERWAKSFALIDGQVFQLEDLAVVEAIQRGLAANANETLLFGELEAAALWFHDHVERELADRRHDFVEGQRLDRRTARVEPSGSG